MKITVRFNGHFPGVPGLAGTRMSPFWILLELRVMEVLVTTGAVRREKLHSKCQQTDIQKTRNLLGVGNLRNRPMVKLYSSER